ncbi:MAG: hypothetical protein PHO26_10295 [Dehalococcoidia bacterium]|nr:hypothetical protein [Dehalococcoidia bacterium]MDD5494265.1 hypothetical protein [Dehalococcoidia bacterium]
MAPPPIPSYKDLRRRKTIAPGKSVQISYTGFLDRSLAAGNYRVRYASVHPALGGFKDKVLQSEWLNFSIGETGQAAAVRSADLIASLPVIREGGAVLECEVDKWLRQITSNAGEYDRVSEWVARFHLKIDKTNKLVTVTVYVRLIGEVSNSCRDAWEKAIENAWSNIFKLCCNSGDFQIVTDLQFVDRESHYGVHVDYQDTTDMRHWLSKDTINVRHEFGHMLGDLDEYYTVNGRPWGNPGQRKGSIMNNSKNRPAAHHYKLIQDTVAELLQDKCTTRPITETC